ncbi:hypothetical protein HanIR_Chr17g0888421 [Helianthus annuus]|nr:hypothetical protein HanIR_Chr17g0888421 [Helianthus annuus]
MFVNIFETKASTGSGFWFAVSSIGCGWTFGLQLSPNWESLAPPTCISTSLKRVVQWVPHPVED